MTTPTRSGIVWSTVRPEENPSFVAFVDTCFALPEGASLRSTFPVALHPSNADHQYAGSVGERWTCAATAVVRDWITSEGRVRAAAVGCFATALHSRGQGFSARLQTEVLARLADEDVQWVALWTDEPQVYRGRGFEPCGSEAHADLGSVRWPSCPPGLRVRRGEQRDASQLIELHRAHPWRVERSLEDMHAHLDPACSEVWIVEDERRVLAHVGIGKGVDFAGYVADFAGEPALVHVLWGVATRRGAQAVLLPAGSDAYLTGPARGLRGTERHAALVHRLAGPDPRTCAWAVHGFDSA